MVGVIVLVLLGLAMAAWGAWTIRKAQQIDDHFARVQHRRWPLWQWRSAGVVISGIGMFVVIVAVLYGVGYLPR